MADYKIKKIDGYKWEIARDETLGMHVPGIVYADDEILEHARAENTLSQVVNVANLPGIVKASFAMPDIHFGYGFPIGGVAATDTVNGVISPGGVGFDISCGVRLLKTLLDYSDIKNMVEDIIHSLFVAVPKGIGSKGRIRASRQEMEKIFKEGTRWAIKNGYGDESDSYFTEENGCMDGADPGCVSKAAYDRGNDQIGSLGSGNHFLELQRVSEIYDDKAARVMGLYENQVTVMIHSGSRGLGHQICGDYLKEMQRTGYFNRLNLPDRQLACAGLSTTEGKKYLAAMICAVNYAIVNRHCLAHWVRVVFEQIFSRSWQKLGMSLLYDVSHNVAKMEEYNVDGKKMKLCVHRKGATRALGPGSPYIPEQYREIGQPVIVPGDMGRYSFIMTGTEKAMTDCFGSTCHGAGRIMSRTKAQKMIDPNALKKELRDKKGIIVMAGSNSTLSEEAPQAYKDVSQVVEVAHRAGISKKVAKLEPLGVIKG
jgi:tRNA-splicing ligase RtcB (3'-phosphate/5'-hydroxy nucleic acid ligase)